MLNQLIDNYGDFGDALITEFTYRSAIDKNTLTVKNNSEITLFISCFNERKNHERNVIQVICRDIIYYNFHQIEGMIFQAFLNNINGIIVLDFFPELQSNPNGNGLISKEKLNSDCIIKCKEVSYVVISSAP